VVGQRCGSSLFGHSLNRLQPGYEMREKRWIAGLQSFVTAVAAELSELPSTGE
jgi:hypothetical protein